MILSRLCNIQSLVTILAMCLPLMATARQVKFHISDIENGSPLEFALIQAGTPHSYTDTGGDATIALPDSYTGDIDITLVGYKPLRTKYNGSDSLALTLSPIDPLKEVVVTARESRHGTSASMIDTTAMQHLQPSSFSDLLELLPGGLSKDPNTAGVNTIALRQAAGMSNTDNDYMTQALGTQFVVDGVAINTSANMQSTTDTSRDNHITVGKGTDMRAVATDDIEKVEIIRGIAPVEYGELTSGLVNIKRKSGVTRLEARFKADNQSQLFYIGKGFAMPAPKWTMNAGAGYLDSKTDPRNSRENYKRITASLRSNLRWGQALAFQLTQSLNYTGTMERDNNDPDLTVNNTIDRFSTNNHSFSFNNSLSITPTAKQNFWNGAAVTAAVSYSRERLTQERHVAPSRLMPVPVSLTPGPNNVGYLPMMYLARLDTKGDPFTANIKATSKFRAQNSWLRSTFNLGLQWDMSKNYGDGKVYDLQRPITASTGQRPRAFKDVPAMHQLSSWLEVRNNIVTPHAGSLQFNAGVRNTQLLHLDSKYTLAGKPYFDPRGDLTWVLPTFYLGRFPVTPEVGGGAGLMTKMPVALFLYPELYYTDLEQLNYYHNDPAYRVMNVMTYVEDLTNYNLKAARNFKWEARIDLNIADNRLAVTYFHEKMNNGFRHTGNVHRYLYNRYDATGYNPAITGAAPDIATLPYTTESYQTVRSTITNGSATTKQGIEYTLQTKRWRALHTRLTINGAWFSTTNNSSQPLWYKPTIVVAGKDLQYIGLYDDTDGSTYSSLNTNFLFDTDIERLGLRFSAGVHCLWYTKRKTLWRDGIPTHYMDPDGNIHPFTAQSMLDPYLKQLVRVYGSTSFDTYTVPAEAALNLKATKTFWHDRINIAVYVNRLVTVQPDYKRLGVTIRRYSSPYFGMELNLKI